NASVLGARRFLPVIDKWVLPDVPVAIIRRGEHHQVPVLIGNAVEETSWIYYNDSKDLHTEQEYINRIRTKYSSTADELLNLYPPSDYQDFVVDYIEAEGSLRPRVIIHPSPRRAYNAISADHWFVCPAQRIAQALSDHQGKFVGRFLYTHVLSGRS